MPESSVQVRFSADIGQLKEAIEEATESLDGLKEHFMELAELAGIGLSADAFKEWIASSAEAGESLERMAVMLGTSIPQVGDLQAMAKLTGTDFQGLATAMERLQLRLTTTGRESSAVAQALKVMGINAREFAALPIPEQMNRLAEAANHFADGATKTAAFQALGRNFVELLPLLDKGKEGLDEVRGAAEASGAVMSTEMAESFGKTNEALKELGLSMEGLSHRSFAEINQSVTALAQVFARLIQQINPAPIQGQINALVSAIIGMAGQVEEFCLRVTQAWKLMEETIGASRILSMIDAVRDHALEAAHAVAYYLPVVQSVVAIHDAAGIAMDKFGKAMAGVGEQPSPFGALDAQGNRLRMTIQGAQSDLSEFARKFREAQQGADDITVHAKPQMAAFQSGGGRGQNDALRAALIEGDEEVKLAQSAAKQRETILNEELKTKQLSATQWLTATKDALQDELQDTLSVYQREEGLAGLKASQIAQLKAKEAEAVERYNEQILQAEVKATEQIAAQWSKMGDEIVGAFNSQLKGLLSGTTSWSTAMKNIGQDLILKLIENFDKMAVEWIAKQLAMTAASVSGDAARTASATAASTATAATQGTGLLATLGADAAKVFGGVFAFLAPAIGPAAAGPAAASEAAVMAAGTAIPGAAIGGYVLSSGLANIHAGETIVPASLSQPYQGGAVGGGGQTIHNWTVQAMDAQSIMAALSNVSSPLARMIGQTFAREPSTRGAY